MKSKLLSVIVPVYNAEKSIIRCIDSILNSTYVDYEIIIINDGSIDNTMAVIESNYKHNEKIKIIDLKVNKGVSSCRNLGIEKATGDYITFVDSDDYIDSTMYEKMMNIMCDHDIDCCVCDYVEVFSDGSKQKSKYNYKNNIIDNYEAQRRFLLDKISPAIWDKIYKKDLLKRVGKFEDRLQVGEDILFCLNLFKETNNVFLLNNIFYYYEQQEQSVMHTISPRLLQFQNVIKLIDSERKEEYVKKYPDEFIFFKGSLIMRAIHSITVLIQKENRKEAIGYLNQLRNMEILKSYMNSPYLNKYIKLEVFNMLNFGVMTHLLLIPIYKLGRKVLRKI